MLGQPLHIIMLAGGLRASAFRQQLGIPTLRLPLGRYPSLLDAWLTSFESIQKRLEIHIVVSWEDDARHLNPILEPRLDKLLSHEGSTGRISTDPSPWRGTGGLIHDVTSEMDQDDLILVVESSCVPPDSLAPFLDELNDRVNGLVCCTSTNEPKGLFLFRKTALDIVPSEGFFDLKEQLLPSLYRDGQKLLPVKVGDEVLRLRNRETYLHAVHGFLNGTGNPQPIIAPDAHVAASARVLGASVIEAGVTIEAGAIVHNSVILKDATIKAKSLVSRSIVGRRAQVESRSIIRDGVVPFDSTPQRQRVSATTRIQVSSDWNETSEVRV